MDTTTKTLCTCYHQALTILLLVCCAHAARFMYVSPVNSDILMLHFDEGDKNTSECRKQLGTADDIWYSGELDLNKAGQISSYSISSGDDPRFDGNSAPVEVGRKAKSIAANMAYWIYLKLPHPLQSGKTYTVTFTGLADNADSETFTFDELTLRSEAVRVNQVGYAPSARLKYAYVYHWAGTLSPDGRCDFSAYEGGPFHVVRASDNRIVYTGQVAFRSDIKQEHGHLTGGTAGVGWHGTPIWECDFSAVGRTVAVEPGEYRVAVEGVGCSFPFRIDSDVYFDMSKLVLRGLFHQRSGPRRDTPHSDFPKPTDHTPGIDGFELTYTTHPYGHNDGTNFTALPAAATQYVWRGTEASSTPHAGMLAEPDGWGWGGYFDAADCDDKRYHLEIATQLLLAYEIAPGAFADNTLNIPESGNGVPDIIDEARWIVDFFRRLKGPTLGVCGGKETTGYYAPSWSLPDGTGSTDQDWYTYVEDSYTTFWYAGCAAHLAYCLEIAGAPDAEVAMWTKQAKDAFAWAQSTGNDAYYDRMYRYYSGVAIYKATGDISYLNATYQSLQQQRGSFMDVYGSLIFLLIDLADYPTFDATASEKQDWVRTEFLSLAQTGDWGLTYAKTRSLRLAQDWDDDFDWGPGYSQRDVVSKMMTAFAVTGDSTFIDYLYTSADFYLGCLGDNKVFISGADMVGADRIMEDMLHSHSTFDSVPGWIPGIVLYAYGNKVIPSGSCVPAASAWPVYEGNNDTRGYIRGGEFTVHQTMGPHAALYSFLHAMSSGQTAVAGSRNPPAALPSARRCATVSLAQRGGTLTMRVALPAAGDYTVRVLTLDGRVVLRRTIHAAGRTLRTYTLTADKLPFADATYAATVTARGQAHRARMAGGLLLVDR